MHMGVDGWGRPHDIVGRCAALDADVLVLQESWTPDDGSPSTAALIAAGLDYQVVAEAALARGRVFGPVPTTDPRWGPRFGQFRKTLHLDGERWKTTFGPAHRTVTSGQWGVALLSRVPVRDIAVILLGQLRRDAARRAVVTCVVDLEHGPLSIFGTHMSHITHGSHAQYRLLGRRLPPLDVAAVLAGDMNMWGPPVNSYVRGWRRAVTGRTWPAHRPHSQLDHVLVTPPVRVLEARIGEYAGSDHRPVVARLTVAGAPGAEHRNDGSAPG